MASAVFRFMLIVLMFHIVAGLHFSVRLTGGISIYEGRLEIYYRGRWGTVCDDGWDVDNARVVCRELGYGDPVQTLISYRYQGSAYQSILLNDVNCSGLESTLSSCRHRHSNNCSHSEDVALECSLPSVFVVTDFQNDWGGWYQEIFGDDFDWTRNSGSTPSSITGPTNGHSGYDNDYYAYIETSDITTSIGMSARLRSPLLPSVHNQTLQFYYHMYGNTIGTLNVYRKSTDGYNILWTKSGSQGNSWHYGEVQFQHSRTGNNYIVFEGIAGSSYTGDIAIDDISISMPTNDDEDPLLGGCPEDLIVDTIQGTNYTEVSWTEPIASDNKGIKTEEQSHLPGDRFELVNGKPTVYIVRYWVQDYSGNEAECLFNITIVDNEPPQLTCPLKTSNYYKTYYGYIHASTDEGSPNGTITWTPSVAKDNSGIPPLITSFPNKPGDVYPMRSFPPYTITIRATDESDNSIECILHFSVVDIESPVVNCPSYSNNFVAKASESSWSVFTDRGSRSARLYWPPANATDNSGTVMSVISNHSPGDVFPVSDVPHQITYTAIDEDNNVGNCSFFITVTIESPVVNCPSYSNNFIARTSESSWSVFTDRGSRSARLYWSPANATDNSGTVVSVTSNHSPGDVFPASDVAHQITYTAIDEYNNMGNCSFFITVEDWESPSVECPFHLQVYTDDGSRFAFLSWNITLNDNIAVFHFVANDTRAVPTNATLNHNNTTLAQNGSFSIGTSVVEYMVTDMSGNMGKCSLSITVIDNEPPSIICPSNFSNYYDYIFGFHRLVADYGRSYATVTWSPPELDDNNQEPVTWESSTYTSGDTFPLRQFPPYTLELTASDLFGNNRSCYVYFTIIDIEPPVITCPKNITNYHDTYYGIVRAAIDPGSATSTVTWDYPTVSDNSGGQVNVTSSHQSGEHFAPRFYPPYEVRYTAEDESGNKNSCKLYFLVTGMFPIGI